MGQCRDWLEIPEVLKIQTTVETVVHGTVEVCTDFFSQSTVRIVLVVVFCSFVVVVVVVLFENNKGIYRRQWTLF